MDVKIICGDAREKLKTIKANSIQCIISSPPYWGLRDYGHIHQIGLENSIDNYLEELRTVFQQLKRILNKTGVFWLNLGDGYTSGNRKYRAADRKYPARFMKIRPNTPNGLKEKELLGLPWRIAFMLQQEGWYLRNDIIWHKPNAMPESVKDRPYRNHEYLFMFTKSPKYFFNQSKLKNSEGKLLRSVWTIDHNSKSTVHSATFPLDLVRFCISSSSRKNDEVLDPFCGVGTAAKVCIELDRKFVGVELNSKYAKTARQTIKRLMDAKTSK